ncbi:MAG: tape measure protein [Clostridiales bacterium]|nr:tape measure protein [Clostridiales bacterium]
MSTVDKRVVQMVFDNDQFEKNLAKSQKSLESIDKQVSTLGNNLKPDTISNAVSKGMSSAETIISAKAELFRGIMLKIGGEIGSFFTNTIAQAQRAINSLTFDQINAGFSKYEEKLSSVQTIMNATGKSIEFVEEQMEKLNWYTDETSANFTDMTNNIGKFTSAGIELEEASQAMMGISNWAYLSGANLQQASAAMYNFSQAMGAGAMQSQDWKSIENANMATASFKETVILTAKELYKSGKISEDVINKYGVTVENFRSTLKDKWFDSTIMMEATKVYGQYSNYVKEIQDNGTKAIAESIKQAYYEANDEEISFNLASGVVDYLDWVQETYTQEMSDIIKQYGADSEQLKKLTSDLGISMEQALDMTKVTQNLKGENVTGYFYNMSKSAFLAAQEYKTFADVISATADAVSTKWMNIFQIIFGNYEEAKKIWTEFGDIFYDIFAQPVDYLLEIMEAWKKFHGQVLLFGTEASSVFTNLRDIFNSIKGALEAALGDVFKETFPHMQTFERMGMHLAYATYKLNQALEEVKDTVGKIVTERDKLAGGETAFVRAASLAEKIREAFRGLLKIVRAVVRVIGSLGKGVLRIIKAILPSFNTILDLFITVDQNGAVLEEKSIQIARTIEIVCKIIAALITKFKQSVMDGTVIEYLTNLGKFLLGSVIQFIKGFFKQAETETTGFAATLQRSGNKVLTVLQNISNFIFTKLTEAYNKFMQTGFGQALGRLFNQLPTLIKNIGGLVINVITQIVNFFALGAEMVNRFFASFKNSSFGTNGSGTGLGILGMLFVLIQSIVMAVMEGKALTIMDSISEAIETFQETLETFQTAIKATILKQIGAAILEIAIAALLLASIEPQKLKVTMLIMGGTLVALLGSMAIISSISSSKVGASGLAGMMKQLTSVAMSMLILAAVMAKISKMDPDEMIIGLLGLAGLMATMAVFIGMLRIAVTSFSKQTVIKYKGEMQALTKLMQTMFIMVIAINMLRPALKALGKLPREELTQGVSALMFLGIYLGLMMLCISRLANPSKTSHLITAESVVKFYSNIKAIAITLGIVVVAIGLLVASLVILSAIPMPLLLQGYLAMSFLLKWVGKLFKQISKLMANLANSSHIISSSAGILHIGLALIEITVAINLLLIPIETMAYTPLPLLVKGGVATILLMSWMVIFVGGLIEILSGRSLLGGTGMANALRIDRWATDMIFISLALMAIAISINILIKPVTELGSLPLGQLVKGFLATLAVMTMTFAFISATVFMGKYLDPGPQFEATMLSTAGALLLLAAGMQLIADVIKHLGEMDAEVYESGVTKIGEILGWLIMLCAVFALISSVVKMGTRRLGDTAGIAKNVFYIGAGLLAFVSALLLLLIPLSILSNISDPKVYEDGIIRLAFLMGVLAAFIGLLMVFYGLMTKVSGGSKVLTEQTEVKRKGIFSKRKKTKDTITSFGKDMADFGKALMMVVGAITVLILPLTILGNLDLDVYAQGLAGLAIIMAMLSVLIAAIGYTLKDVTPGKIWSMIGLMAVMAIILFAVVEMVKSTGEYMSEWKWGETDNWIKFILGVVGTFGVLALLIGGLYLLTKSVGEPGKMLAAAGSLAIMGAAILAISFAVKMIADAVRENENAVLNAEVFISIIMALAAVYIYILNYFLNPSDLLTAAASFAIMAAGVVAIAGALAIVAALDPSWDNAFQVIAIIATLFIAIGILGKVVPGANLIQVAAALLIISAAFVVMSLGVVALAGAVIMLVDAAEKSKDGWAALEKGVAILATIAIVLGVVVVLFAVLGGLWLPGAVGAILFAGAVFLVALAFYLVVQGLVDLANNWSTIDECLTDLTTWLEEHKDEWELILNDFTSLIVSSMLTAVDNILSQTSTMVQAVIGILKMGWVDYFKDLGAQIYDARQENKRLQSLDEDAQKQLGARVDTARAYLYKDAAFKARYNNQDFDTRKAARQEVYIEALKDFMLTSTEWRFARQDELNELLSELRKEDTTFNEDEWREMFIQAGGTFIDANGNQINLLSRKQDSAGAYIDKLNQAYDEERKAEEERFAAMSRLTAKSQEQTKRVTANINDNYKDERLYSNTDSAYWDRLEDVGLGGGVSGDGNIIADEVTITGDSDAAARLAALRAKAQNDPTYNAANKAEAEAAMVKWGGQTGVTAGANAGAGFVDTAYSVIANGFSGNAGNVVWAAGLKDFAESFSNSVGTTIDDLKKNFESWLKKSGIEFNFSDSVDQFASTIGLDTNSELYKKIKTNLSWEKLSGKARDTITTWQQYMVQGKDPVTAFVDAVGWNWDTSSWLNEETLKEVTDFLGISDIFTDEDGNKWLDFSDFLKLGEGENPIADAISEAAGNFNMEDLLNTDDLKLPELDLGEMTKMPEMNLDDLYDKYGFGQNDFSNLGGLDGNAYMEGLADSMTNNSSFANAGEEVKSQLAGYTGQSKDDNMVLRGLDGTYIEAAKTLDLVAPIFQETAKKAEEAAKGYNQIQDYSEPGAWWRRDEGADFWYKVNKEGIPMLDENGNMYTMDNRTMDANVNLWNSLIAKEQQEQQRSKEMETALDNRIAYIESLSKKEYDKDYLALKSFVHTKDASGKDVYGRKLNDGKILVTNNKGTPSQSKNGKLVVYDPTTGKYTEVENKDVVPLRKGTDLFGRTYYGRQIDTHKVVITDKSGNPILTEDGRLKFYDPTAQKYYVEQAAYQEQSAQSQQTTADGVMLMADATQNAQNSQPQTSAVNGQKQTNKASTGSQAYAQQVNQTSAKNQQKSGTAQNQQTGTTSASAAQSAASATDYLRAINERANLMYNTLVEMNTRQVDMAENLNSVANNTYACATTPIPATIDQKEVKNLAKSVNLILGMKAELSKRGV